MFYTLIKHGFLTNQSVCRVLSIFLRYINNGMNIWSIFKCCCMKQRNTHDEFSLY